MTGYKTENDLKWMQSQRCLREAFEFSIKKKSFEAMSKLQEADIVLRSIINLEEIEAKRNG